MRVLVCPWAAFADQGECEPRSIGIWPQLINICSNCHQNGIHMQPNYHTNNTLGHPRAVSERLAANRNKKLGAHWIQKNSQDRCFGAFADVLFHFLFICLLSNIHTFFNISNAFTASNFLLWPFCIPCVCRLLNPQNLWFRRQDGDLA